MPVHDWEKVEAGIHHHFHVSWISELNNRVNGGLLPNGYYALAEQHAGRTIPADLPLTLASYNAGPPIDAYVEHFAVGGRLIDMPLFLTPDRYVSVPLDATYGTAFQRMPAFWRNVLES